MGRDGNSISCPPLAGDSFLRIPLNPQAWWGPYVCAGTLGGLTSLLSVSPEIALLNVRPHSTHCFQLHPLSGNSKVTEKPHPAACYPSLYPQLPSPPRSRLSSSLLTMQVLNTADDYIFPGKRLDLAVQEATCCMEDCSALLLA